VTLICRVIKTTMLRISVTLNLTSDNEKVEHYIRINIYIDLMFWIESSINPLYAGIQVSLIFAFLDDLTSPNIGIKDMIDTRG